MSEYLLAVQGELEERQLRRLGAAVSLLWNDLPKQVQDDLVLRASTIKISGETARSDQLQDQILHFLQSHAVGAA